MLEGTLTNDHDGAMPHARKQSRRPGLQDSDPHPRRRCHSAATVPSRDFTLACVRETNDSNGCARCLWVALSDREAEYVAQRATVAMRQPGSTAHFRQATQPGRLESMKVRVDTLDFANHTRRNRHLRWHIRVMQEFIVCHPGLLPLTMYGGPEHFAWWRGVYKLNKGAHAPWGMAGNMPWAFPMC